MALLQPTNKKLDIGYKWCKKYQKKTNDQSRFKNNKEDNYFLNLLKNDKKAELPLFDFGNHPIYRLIIADWDTLPWGFDDWNDFRSYLSQSLLNGHTTTSPSGKAKTFFLVPNRPNLDVKATLKSLVGDALYEMTDTAGTRFCFLNEEMYFSLRKWLKSESVVSMPVLKQGPEIKTIDEFVAGHKAATTIKNTANKIENILSEKGFKYRGIKNSIIALWLACNLKDLVEGTASFGVEATAKILGTNRNTASRIINRLTTLGIISTNGKYTVGVKTKTFTGCEEICSLITTNTGTSNDSNNTSTNINFSIPSIGNGNRFYLGLASKLASTGSNYNEIFTVLTSIDNRRDNSLRRSSNYFEYLAAWTLKKFAKVA